MREAVTKKKIQANTIDNRLAVALCAKAGVYPIHVAGSRRTLKGAMIILANKANPADPDKAYREAVAEYNKMIFEFNPKEDEVVLHLSWPFGRFLRKLQEGIRLADTGVEGGEPFLDASPKLSAPAK